MKNLHIISPLICSIISSCWQNLLTKLLFQIPFSSLTQVFYFFSTISCVKSKALMHSNICEKTKLSKLFARKASIQNLFSTCFLSVVLNILVLCRRQNSWKSLLEELFLVTLLVYCSEFMCSSFLMCSETLGESFFWASLVVCFFKEGF